MKARNVKEFTAVIMAFSMMLTACFEMHPPTEPAPSQSEPASVSSEPESSAPVLRLDYFDTHTATHTDAWDDNEQAVAEWAKYTYQEFGVSDVNAFCTSGNVGLSADSDNGCIDVRDYRISIKSETPIPDSYDRGNGEYIISVLSIAAASNMQTEQTVIDILTPDQFDASDHIDVLYERVKADKRFADYLLPYKEDVLPDGAVLTDVSTLLPEYSATVWHDSLLMDDGTYVSAYVHSMTETDGAVAILFVNADGYKTVETGVRARLMGYGDNIYPWTAQSLILDDYMFQPGDDCVMMYRYGEEKIDHLLRIYPDGTVEEYVGDDANKLYNTCEYPSDNGEHLIIQEFDSIYLAGEDSRELLLHMSDEEKGEDKFTKYRAWTFVDWLDDDRFICGIAGYMGIREYYIYDLTTRSLTKFEPVEATYVQGSRNGKIILMPNAMITASTDVWEYDPDTGEAHVIPNMPSDFAAGTYSMGGDIFVFANHTQYPYGDFKITAYDPEKGEIIKTIEGYLHHNRISEFVYNDGRLCGLIEAGPFTPTYYAVFE